MMIRYFAGAAEAAGHEEREIDSAGLTVAQLRERLGAENEKLVKVLAASALLADGVRVDDGATDLSAVGRLDVLPPFAGG